MTEILQRNNNVLLGQFIIMSRILHHFMTPVECASITKSLIMTGVIKYTSSGA